MKSTLAISELVPDSFYGLLGFEVAGEHSLARATAEENPPRAADALGRDVPLLGDTTMVLTVTVVTHCRRAPNPHAPGLPGGASRSSLPTAVQTRTQMPSACPGESHAARYPPPPKPAPGCPRLARGSLTLLATHRRPNRNPDAPGSPGGASRSSLPTAAEPRTRMPRLARASLTLSTIMRVEIPLPREPPRVHPAVSP